VDVFRGGTGFTTANDGHYVNSRTFTGPATYLYKVCQAGTTTCSNEVKVVFGSPPNAPPSAGFTGNCGGLTCTFADGSSDSDGSIAGWAWDFGDQSSSGAQNPAHAYEAAGTYTVTLTVTDNGGARGSTSRQVTVSGTAPPISLRTSGRSDATTQYMTLDWTGATGTNVDVYRNGPRLTATLNDGHYTNSRTFTGPATYVYKVCNSGTTTCSNEATVVFR
jgi:PKD repeat protein